MSQTAGRTFALPIEGIGTFIFAKRNMRLQFKITAEFTRLTEGLPEGDLSLDARATATAVATLKVLTVEAPEGWGPADLDNVDPLDEEAQGKLARIFLALRAREDSFRKGSEPAGEDKREEAVPNP
jgi:hypothetical protein